MFLVKCILLNIIFTLVYEYFSLRVREASLYLLVFLNFSEILQFYTIYIIVLFAVDTIYIWNIKNFMCE